MKRSSLITLVALVLILAAAAAATLLVYGHRDREKDSPAAQLLSDTEHIYTDISGNPVKLSNYEGKVRVVALWASWCPSCASELRDLNALAESYGDGLVVLAVNRKEPKETAQRFLKTVGDVPRITLIIDQEDYFYRSVGGYAMPETIIYDTKGREVLHARGDITREELDTAVQSAEVAS
jgi:cytochrome c biogenesis protein CcmG/thiol:disulfide interchange protein DsbE